MTTVDTTGPAPELTRVDVQALITKRAWEDEGFKAEFLADPKGTIERHAGQKLPDTLRIVAHAEDETTVHFVIPPRPRALDELSDDDLEAVAGGIGSREILQTVSQVSGYAAAFTAAAAVHLSQSINQAVRRAGW